MSRKEIKKHFVFDNKGNRFDSPSKYLSILTNDIYNKEDSKYMEQGKALADALEVYFETGEKTEDERIAKDFNAVLNYLKKNKLKIIETEKLVVNKSLKYYGYIDLVAKNKKGNVVLIEIKNTHKLTYAELQMAYYFWAYKMTIGDNDNAWCETLIIGVWDGVIKLSDVVLRDEALLLRKIYLDKKKLLNQIEKRKTWTETFIS